MTNKVLNCSRSDTRGHKNLDIAAETAVFVIWINFEWQQIRQQSRINIK